MYLRNPESKIEDLYLKLKMMLQYHKEQNSYSLHLSLADDCFNFFNKPSNKIKQFCEAEQNLAMGVDAKGERIKDPMRTIISLITEPELKTEDKLRLLMLFLLNKAGITDDNLIKLLGHAGMLSTGDTFKNTILNMHNLGLKILLEGNRVSFFSVY